MKTAQTIETSEERKAQSAADPTDGKVKYARGKNPNSHRPNRGAANLIAGRWQPGQSGNPGGRPKNDVANEIARAVFENNKEQLYKAFARAALKGNAYAFSQLADRAYGKLKERVEISPGGEFSDMSSEALIERVKQLEAKLGYSVSSDNPRGTGINPVRTLPPSSSPED